MIPAIKAAELARQKNKSKMVFQALDPLTFN